MHSVSAPGQSFPYNGVIGALYCEEGYTYVANSLHEVLFSLFLECGRKSVYLQMTSIILTLKGLINTTTFFVIHRRG